MLSKLMNIDRTWKKPLVSVGIPTFNRPAELKHILQQVLKQTYENIEIIVLDNCSTQQDVQRIAQEFAGKNSNVKYFRNSENLGVLKNAPELLKYATGKYFCWVSDDDHRSVDFIERTVDFLENNHDIGCVFCSYREVDINGMQFRGYPLNHSELMWFLSLRCKWLRRILYYLSSASCGKCNAFYGLFRIDILRGMNFSKLSDSYTALDMDCMIVYQTLAATRIPILEFEGCLLTVGNKKDYEITKNNNGWNRGYKIKNLFHKLNYERKRYIGSSSSIEVYILTIVFPVKVVAELIRSALKIKCLSPFTRSAR